MKQDGRALARDNEIAILRALHRFGWLGTRLLSALVWQRWAEKAPTDGPSLRPPTTTESALRMAQRTLRRMRDKRLVLSAQAPDGSVIYALSEAGARALQDMGVDAASGKDLMRSFSTSHFRHRSIANEVAISAIIEGFRASTEREISQGRWLGGLNGIAGKKPDALLRSGSIVHWVEVERSKKNSKSLAFTISALEGIKQDAAQPVSRLLGNNLTWAKVIFICTIAYRAKLRRELVALGWSEKDLDKFLRFEMSLYSFKDIMFS